MENKRYVWYITPEDYKRAEVNGISRVTLSNRVRICGWDIERACTEPVRKKIKLTEEQEKRLQESGLRRGTFLSRINALNWSIEEALTKPLQIQRKEYNDIFSEDEKNLK